MALRRKKRAEVQSAFAAVPAEASVEPAQPSVPSSDLFAFSDMPAVEPAEPLQVEGASPPRVTAIMAFGDGRRWRLALRAIANFAQQTYLNKELIVVNSVARPLPIPGIYTNVRQIMADTSCTKISDIRNAAISEIKDGWIVPWDDDDFSYPTRLVYQMAHRRKGYCVMLCQELRIDVRSSVVAVWNQTDGIPGTVMFPAGHPEGTYNAAMHGGENENLVQRFGSKRIVLDNRGDLVGPAYHLACWHGGNLLSRDSFLGPYAADEYRTRGVTLPTGMGDWVAQVLRESTLRVDVLQRQPSKAVAESETPS